MSASRGAVRGRSLTRVAVAPHLGQQRAASAAGSVITSATVQPSPVTVTDVTTSPGIPSSAVAAAQDGAQPAGAACAGPGAAGSVHEGGSFWGFQFLGRNENPGGTAYLSACLCNSQPYLLICGQARYFPEPRARNGNGNGIPGKSQVLDVEKGRVSGAAGETDRTGSKGFTSAVSVPGTGGPPGPPGNQPPLITDGSKGADASAGAVAASRLSGGSCPGGTPVKFGDPLI